MDESSADRRREGARRRASTTPDFSPVKAVEDGHGYPTVVDLAAAMERAKQGFGTAEFTEGRLVRVLLQLLPLRDRVALTPGEREARESAVYSFVCGWWNGLHASGQLMPTGRHQRRPCVDRLGRKRTRNVPLYVFGNERTSAPPDDSGVPHGSLDRKRGEAPTAEILHLEIGFDHDRCLLVNKKRVEEKDGKSIAPIAWTEKRGEVRALVNFAKNLPAQVSPAQVKKLGGDHGGILRRLGTGVRAKRLTSGQLDLAPLNKDQRLEVTWAPPKP